MRHVWMLVLAGGSLLDPCGKKEEGAADAAGDVAAPVVSASATPPPVAEPVAKNASRIARFPNDTKLNMEKEKLQADHTFARESPGGGTVVASLNKGTEVTKVAQRGDSFLVAFADPKDAPSTLMGWISKAAFAPTPAAPKTCVKPTVKFDVGCRIDCTAAGSCPAGFACTGIGGRPEINSGAFRFCEGADGGAPPPTPVVADAGLPPRPTNCAAGQVGWDDGKCHLKCTTNADCGGKGTCTPFGGGVSGCLP